VANSDSSIHCFGAYELDEARMLLQKAGEPVELETKPFLLLQYLVRNAGRVIPHTELMREVWGGVRVSDGSIKTAVHSLRRALADAGAPKGLIATVRGSGYMFRGDVQARTARAGGEPVAREECDSATCGEHILGEDAFIGREAELAELARALSQARSGQLQLVVIRGPAGIGKTRLGRELQLRAREAGFDALVGHAQDRLATPPLWPLRQLLRRLAEQRPPGELIQQTITYASDLTGLVPELARHLAAEPSPPLCEPRDSDPRFRQYDAILQLLEGASRLRPLCIVLDDVHAADEATLELLEMLCRELGEARVLLAVTYRSDVTPSGERVPSLLRRMALERGGRSLAVAGLEPKEVARALTAALQRRATAREIDAVLRATGGNPLFVLEVGRLLRDRPMSAAANSLKVPVPERVRDAVLLRLEARSDACLHLLRCASVLPQPFFAIALAPVVTLEALELLEALDEGVAAHLLERDSDHGSFCFAHGIVQDVVYAALGEPERMRLHARVGEMLEKSNPSSLHARSSEIAYQFMRAVPLVGVDRALGHVERAAEAARREFAFSEEVMHYEQALGLLEQNHTSSPVRHCMLLLRLGWALCSASREFERVDRTLTEALDLAKQLGRFDLAAHAAVTNARYARLTGNTAPIYLGPVAESLRREHEASLESLLSEREIRRTPPLRGRVLLTLASMAHDGGQLERAYELVTNVLGLLRAEEDPELQCTTLLELFTLSADWALEDRFRILETAIEAGQRAERNDLENFGLVYRAHLALVAGERSQFRRSVARIEELFERTRHPRIAVALGSCRALEAQLEGDSETADRQIQLSMSLSLKAQYAWPWSAGVVALTEWWKALLAGRAAAVIPAAVWMYERDRSLPLSRLALAHLQAEAGNLTAARELEVDPLATLDVLPRDLGWLGAASLCAELCAALEDRERGAELLERLRPHASQGVTFGWLVVCTGPLARSLGRLAAALGRWNDAEELMQEAIRFAERLESPVLYKLAEEEYARVLAEHPSELERKRARERSV